MGEVTAVLVAAVVAAVAGVVTARWQRPKITAESESLSVRTLKEALQVVKDEVKELRSEVQHLEGRVLELEGETQHQQAGIDILTGQVRELGGLPRWSN